MANYFYPRLGRSGGGGSAPQVKVIAQTEGLNFTVGGVKLLAVVPPGRTFVIEKIHLFLDSGVPVGTMSVSVGIDPSTTNIIPITPVSGFDGTEDQIANLRPEIVSFVAHSGENIWLDITTPFTGTAIGSAVIIGLDVND